MDVLVVDDMGAAGAGETDWRRDIAWRLFEARYVRHRRDPRAVTIVTSNLDPRGLETAFGEPVASRVLGVAVPVEINGDDARRVA